MPTHLTAIAILLLFSPLLASPATQPASPFAIPTFHCIGLYWSPPAGCAEKQVLIRYRAKGDTAWKQGLPMRYNPIDKTDEDLADYRGSIVHLAPATTYEIELTLAGTMSTATLTASTWSEQFPTGPVTPVPNRDTPLEIKESGTPAAYRVYDGKGAVIDVRHQHNHCILLDASYVILRNFTLKGANCGSGRKTHGGGAIQIVGGQNIVIEDCDISDWGQLDPKRGFGANMNSGIYSACPTLKRLIVQRCRIHHPAHDGSTWFEPTYPTHTEGPQTICLYNTDGNHVFRYNELTSDLEHMYNDTVGGGSNGSFRGFPGPDSDVYGNIVSHCWDDGLEIEGGNRNTRVWGNYITQAAMPIANAATSIGPLYIWRNVSGRCQKKLEFPGMNFLKMGYAGSEDWQTGHMYLFHNTIFNEGGWLPTGALGGNRIVKHCVSRNNILNVKETAQHSLSPNTRNIDNDYDYDLYNGQIPEKCEMHGIRGTPVYDQAAGFNPSSKNGNFQLAPASPGLDAGEVIPNFSDGYHGKAPDIGAHERGGSPMVFGVNAARSKGLSR